MDRTIIRLMIFAILLTSLQGSILCMQSLVVIKLCGEQYHKMQLRLLKWSAAALLLPVAFLVLVMEEVDLKFAPFIPLAFRSTFLISTESQAARVYSVLAEVWLAGAVLHAVITAIPRYCLLRLRRSCIPVADESWQALLEEYRQRFGIRRVALSQHYGLRSTITVGILHPEIILPVQDYTMTQMHMILAHEMNHIKNKDLLWKRICLAAEGIHWFNPLVRLLTGKVIYLEEVICDRQSVECASEFSVQDYGRFLADVEDNQIGESAVAALCESRNIVARRISLLTDGSRKLLPGRFVFPACLTLLLICTLFLSHTAATYAAESMYGVSGGVLEDAEEPAEWSYTFSEVMPEGTEEWSYVSVYDVPGGIPEGTEESTEANLIYGAPDLSVTEKDVSVEYTEAPFEYEGVLEAKTRYLVFATQMPEGAEISLVYNSKEDEAIRVGIKDLSTGELAYEEAGHGGYSYTVPIAGNYAVYIENGQDHDLNGYVLGYYLE